MSKELKIIYAVQSDKLSQALNELYFYKPQYKDSNVFHTINIQYSNQALFTFYVLEN